MAANSLKTMRKKTDVMKICRSAKRSDNGNFIVYRVFAFSNNNILCGIDLECEDKMKIKKMSELKIGDKVVIRKKPWERIKATGNALSKLTSRSVTVNDIEIDNSGDFYLSLDSSGAYFSPDGRYRSLESLGPTLRWKRDGE